MTGTQDMALAGQGMDTVVFVVLFLVFGLVRVLGELAKQRANRKDRPSPPTTQRGGKGEWEDWKSVFEEMSSGRTPTAKPVSQRPASVPPVLDAEVSEPRGDADGPTASPRVPPVAAWPRPVIMSAPKEEIPIRVNEPAPAVAASVGAVLGALEVSPEPTTRPESPRAMMSESFSAGFPQNVAIPPPLALGTHRRISVRLHSRRDLRQGIVLSEVLGQPRAFDV